MLLVKRSVLLGVLIGLSSQALAVGLGDITLNSYVNEPLDAQIKLLDTGPLADAEVRVALATSEDFDRLGVERLFALGDLTFETTLNDRGSGMVRLTSSEPILEPYLNFLVELRWPSGRLLREYTLLIDLPPARPEGELSARVSEQSLTPSVRDTSDPAEASPRAARGQYRVEVNDTLWEIAQSVKPESVSVEQMMLAIQASNPEAFLRDNINGLKAGYLLSFPIEITPGKNEREARQAVADQWRIWREPAQPALRIVADSELEFDLDPIEPAPRSEVDPLVERARAVPAPEPIVANNNLADIEQRLTQLSAQVGQLQGVVQDKDAEIVELQRALNEALRANQGPGTQVATVVEATANVAASPSDTAASGSSWLTNLLYLVLTAAVLAVAALAVIRRLKRDDDMGEEELLDSGDQLPVEDPLKPVPSIPDEPVAEASDSADVMGYGDSLLTGYTSDQTLADAVAEADIYVAYGRHQHALDTLEAASSAEPSNASGLLKMLEIYLTLDRIQEAEELLPIIEATGDLMAHSAAVERFNKEGAVLTGSTHHDSVLMDDSTEAEAEELVAPGSSADDSLSVSSGEQATDIKIEPESAAVQPQEDSFEEEGLSIDLEFVEDASEQDGGDSEASDPAEPESVIDEDAVDTNLELARAYLDMGDQDGARELIESVLAKGDLSQQAAAQDLLKSLS